MRLGTVLAALLASLSLVAAGCGGDDEESATVAWADSFCTAVTGWTQELRSIGEGVGDPSSLSVDALRDAVAEASAATDEFVEEIRMLGRPETESGEQIESAIESLADALEAEKEEVEQAIEDVEGIPGAVTAATAIAGSLQEMGAQFQATFELLEDLDVRGELEDAFEQAEACEELR